jgi:hypothetical protein
MKRIIVLLAMLIAARYLTAQTLPTFTQEEIKRMMDTLDYSSTQVFIGKFIQEDSYESVSSGIYTAHRVEIKAVLKGNLNLGTVDIITDGGTYNDMTFRAWDYVSIPSEYFIFFGNDAQALETPVANYQNDNQRGVRIFDIVGFKGNDILHPSKGSGNLFLYTGDYLTYLQIFYGMINNWDYMESAERIAMPGNTSPKIDNSKNEENYNNFLKHFDSKKQAITNSESGNKNSQVLSNGDLFITFGPATETGSNPRYLEFDILAASNNAGYFDNVMIRFKYSQLAFGSSVVANNKIIVTALGGFNNASHMNPQTVMSDLTTGTVSIPFGTTIPSNRVLLSSTPMPMLHVKMEITSCYQNANIEFADTANTSIYSLFAPTMNAGYASCLPYDYTYYSGNINPVLCDVIISDFTWPLRAGIGDVLTITGNNFGTTKGIGKITFVNADGGSMVNDLNAMDYISWSDTEIKIRMPSRVDSTFGLAAPGGGNFKVTNSSGNFAWSTLNSAGKPFEIYYAIDTEDRVINGNLTKWRVNLLNKNGQGGYTIRVNPNDFPPGSAVRGCLLRAIYDWRCLTGANIILGTDTVINYVNNTVDGFNYVFMRSTGWAAGEVGRTINAQNICQYGANGYFGAKQEFDMIINSTVPWFSDTTSAPVPLMQVDLYAVFLHEFGHAVGLGHTSNSVGELMYWSGGSPGVRKILLPSTGPADGGTYNVNASVTQLTAASPNTCGNITHVPQNAFTCLQPYGLGVPEVSAAIANFKVYPNPIENHFIISYELNDHLDLSFKMIDVTGRELLNYKPNNANIGFHQEEISSSDLPAGIYFLFIEGNGKSKGIKIVK